MRRERQASLLTSRAGRRPPSPLVATLVLGAALASAGDSLLAQASESSIEWTNPFLGPAYAQWLVGAIGELASEEERGTFLALEDDAEAERFVEEFWRRGDRPQLRGTYEERAAEADRRFSEGAYPGRRTDRGTIFILFGEPEDISYEEFRNVDDPDVEMWRYSKKETTGLNGDRPLKVYRFAKQGEFTRLFHRGGQRDPEVMRRRQPRSFRPPP